MAATWFSPMTTHAPARAQVPARRHTAVRPRAVQVTVPTRPGWLERLALWAEARPAHRRMGSWTMDC